MSTDEKILVKLSSIEKRLLDDKSPYCDTQEACVLIGVTNERYLAQLFQRGYVQRYPRGNGFKYKKADLKVLAEKLDRKEIILTPIIKPKKDGL